MTPALTIEGTRSLLLVAGALALADKMNRDIGSPPAVGSVELQAAIKATLECTAVQPNNGDLGELTSGAELTSKQVAALLGVSRSTITRNAKKYRGRREGIKWLFPADYIYDLIGVNE